MAFPQRNVGDIIQPSHINDLQNAVDAMPETIRDTIGLTLVAGDGIIITVNDAANTIEVRVDDEYITALAVAL